MQVWQIFKSGASSQPGGNEGFASGGFLGMTPGSMSAARHSRYMQVPYIINSMALITTQLGLIVAVPLLLGHAWVSRAVEKRQALLEEARTLLLTLRSKVEAK